ncbi:MAG: carbon-nitrogen hydrolase [Blastocatellia bacterium]
MKKSKNRDKAAVALIQMRCGVDTGENLDICAARIEEAAKRGANIISTQELFRSRYFCQTEDHAHFALAEAIPGKSTKTLAKLAAAHGVVIVASLFERRAPGLYHNTAVVIDADGELRGKYRKMHIPDDPLFYEKFYFTPGDLGFRSFDTKFGKVGVLVCWDQWYPEAARLTALTGAQILFYPTAIGWQPPEKAAYGERQHSSWETIQRAHAIANGIYVAVTNRIGHEPTPAGHPGEGIEFWGQSFIADPSGQIVTKGSVDQEEILLTECDFGKIDVQRTHWPFLRDRRIDFYQAITQRYLE